MRRTVAPNRYSYSPTRNAPPHRHSRGGGNLRSGRSRPWRAVVDDLPICIATLAILAIFAASNTLLAAGLPLPVPRITLYPGDAILADHLVDRVFHSRLPARVAVHQVRDGLVGKVARRTLLPGKPIPVNAVRDPFLVVQGRNVQIVFQDGGLTITGYAVALQSGGEGDIVSLRNIDSGVMLKGAVLADGTVRLGDP